MGARSIARIYVEESIAEHARTREVLERFPKAEVVSCRRFGEVFNRKQQSFRLQKLRPALILAEKQGRRVLEAPPEYGIGGARNFYFSHMLNCIYDCRYCFLQGMYRSANYVLFVNYEDFFDEIDKVASAGSPGSDSETWFFSGYDCDSLALDSVTGFVDQALPFFRKRPAAFLELRTKSVRIEALERTEAISNCVVAFSFTPEGVHDALEPGVPAVEDRLSAMRRLAARGWLLGLRFDPLIWSPDFESDYADLFRSVFESVPQGSVHSVSFGPFRLPPDFYKRMRRLYPEERLFAAAFPRADKMVGYPEAREAELMAFAKAELERFVPSNRLFPCS